MPWHIVKDHSGCPSSKPWAVVKDSDGSVAGCHETKKDAEAQLAALNINVDSKASGCSGCGPSPPMGVHTMTDHAVLLAEAAKARAGANGMQRSSLPCGETKRDDVKFASEFRAEPVQRDGRDFYLIEGYASMTEKPYEMWDFFGPYEEVVAKDAFDETLAADPMVVYRFNHGGMSMANTKNGRLELWADSLGLGDRAWINAERADVQQLVHAIGDRDVTEQSFMFMIEDATWNEDFSQFRIAKVDLDRGDVGPVTYGANPATLVATRSGEFLAAIPNLPPLAAREAFHLLTARRDIILPPPAIEAAPLKNSYEPAAAAFAKAAPKTSQPPTERQGSSIRLALAQLDVDKEQYKFGPYA